MIVAVSKSLNQNWLDFVRDVQIVAREHLNKEMGVPVFHAYDLPGMEIEIERVLKQARLKTEGDIHHSFSLYSGGLAHTLTGRAK